MITYVLLIDNMGAKAMLRLLSCSSEYVGSPFVCPSSVSPGVLSVSPSFSSPFSPFLSSFFSSVNSLASSVLDSSLIEAGEEVGEEALEIDKEELDGVEGVDGVFGAVARDGGGVEAKVGRVGAEAE